MEDTEPNIDATNNTMTCDICFKVRSTRGESGYPSPPSNYSSGSPRGSVAGSQRNSYAAQEESMDTHHDPPATRQVHPEAVWQGLRGTPMPP